MMRLSLRTGLLYGSAALAFIVTLRAFSAAEIPAPAIDVVAPGGKKLETAVFAGGCFWGVEAVFERLKGVKKSVSGYAGGEQATAHYDLVSSGETGHAEAVQVTYDSAQISYGNLLQVFFAVAHDPTEL